MANFGDSLTVWGQNYKEGMTVTTTPTATDSQRAGQEGMSEILIKAATVVSIPATKKLVVAIQDSADNVIFADTAWVGTITAGATAQEYAPNDIILSYIVPNTARNFVRCLVSSDDAAISGTLDILNTYLPR